MGGYKKVKQWHFTYPRTALPKEDFARWAIESYNPTELYCCQELHKEEAKEGQPQTHLHMHFKVPIPLTKERLINDLKKKFGDYEANRIKVDGVKSWGASTNYANKEDENIFIYNNIKKKTEKYDQTLREYWMSRDPEQLQCYTERQLDMTWKDHLCEEEKKHKQDHENTYYKWHEILAHRGTPIDYVKYQQWYEKQNFIYEDYKFSFLENFVYILNPPQGD